MANYFGTTYVQLANLHNVVNLSSYRPGEPEYFIKKILEDVIRFGHYSLHQYTRSSGHPRLIAILCRVYTKLLQRSVNPNDEIMTSVGGREAVFCAIQSIIKPNDEVIVIEPFREEYISLIRMAHGIPVTTLLMKVLVGTEYKWVLDKQHLRFSIRNNTKAILFNNPNSINGKVYTPDEVAFITDVCLKKNLICISDESYEFLVHEPHKHIRIACNPGMWERTVAIGSAGISLFVTGWRVGWAYGSRMLIVLMKALHRNCVFGGNTIFEEAVAKIFEREITYLDDENSYFNKRRRELCKDKKFICDILRQASLVPIEPDAGVFVFADFSMLENNINILDVGGTYKDFIFVDWFAKHKEILGCPVTPFFTEVNKTFMEKHVRLCFVGGKENLIQARFKLIH